MFQSSPYDKCKCAFIIFSRLLRDSTTRYVGPSVDRFFGRLVGRLVPFLGSSPKRPMSCRTQGGISRCLFVHLSVYMSVHPSLPSFSLNNMEN